MRNSALVFTLILAVVTMLRCFGQSEPATPSFSTLMISSPANGSVLTGDETQIEVAFRAVDGKRVSKLKVYLDGKLVTERAFGTPVAEGTAAFKWDISRTERGQHRLDIQAFADKDYLAMGTCVVMVQGKQDSRERLDMRAPEVAMSSPAEGQVVSGKVKISVSARDNSGQPPFVSISVDGALKAMRNLPPYTYEWDTRTHENGPHTIEITAEDDAENRAMLKPVRVIVKNPVQKRPVAAPSVERSPSLPSARPPDDFAQSEPVSLPRATGVPTDEPTVPAETEEPTVKVSSMVQEYRVTVASGAEVLPDAFEIRETAVPDVHLPVISSSPVVVEAVAGERMAIGTEPDGVATSSRATESVAPASVSQPAIAATIREVAPPQVTQSSPVSSLQPAADLPDTVSDLSSPQLRSDARLATPSVAKKPVARVGKSAGAGGPAFYVVREGDTLRRIAAKLGVSLDSLIKLNKIRDPGLIKTWQKLRVPPRTGEPVVGKVVQ